MVRDSKTFEEVKPPVSQRKMFACMAVQRGLDGICRRCSKIYRKGKIPTVCKHFFTIAVENTEDHQKIKSKNDSTYDKLIRHLGIVTSVLNLSLNQATSDELRALLSSAVQVGYALRHQPPQQMEGYQLPKLSRKSLRKSICDLSIEFTNKNLCKAQNTGFVSVAIDGATIIHSHHVFVMLTNPNAELLPIYYTLQTGTN
jgi:hypothetical protein